MSDLMLFGVLRMPYEMAMWDELSRYQFYQRAQEAADRLEAAEVSQPAPQNFLKERAQLEAEWIKLRALQEAYRRPAPQGEQEPVAWAVPCSRACADGSMEDGPVQFVDHASSGEYSKRIGIPLYSRPAPDVLSTLRAKVVAYADGRTMIPVGGLLALIDKARGDGK